MFNCLTINYSFFIDKENKIFWMSFKREGDDKNLLGILRVSQSIHSKLPGLSQMKTYFFIFSFWQLKKMKLSNRINQVVWPLTVFFTCLFNDIYLTLCMFSFEIKESNLSDTRCYITTLWWWKNGVTLHDIFSDELHSHDVISLECEEKHINVSNVNKPTV